MIKFKKIPLEAINWSDSELKSFIDNKRNWFPFPNPNAIDEVYVANKFLNGNLKAIIHKAFLYLSPKYRKINNWPYMIQDIPEKIRTLYD